MLDTVVDAAYAAEMAWALTSNWGGYPLPHHVHQVVTWLGLIIRALATLADGLSKEQVPVHEGWWRASGLLVHAFHTISEDQPFIEHYE